MSLPSLWPTLAWILSGVLLFLAVAKITARFRYAFVSFIAWEILLAILYAPARPWLVFYSWYFVVPPLLMLMFMPWLGDVWKQIRGLSSAESDPKPVLQEATICNAWLIGISVALLGFLLMMWHLFSLPEPVESDPTYNVSWGVSFYTSLPFVLQIVGFLIVICSMAWALFSRGTVKSSASIQSEDTFRRDRRFWQWFVLALLLFGIALFIFAPAVYSEGDSSLFDRLINKNNGAVWQEAELLDFLLKVKLYQVLSFVLTVPTQAFQIMAVVAGAVYLAGTVVLGRTLGRDRIEALIFVAALLSIANVLFFFRYVENYALMSATSLFVFWGCWQYVEGRIAFTTICLLAAIAALIHGAAFWWGPMVLAAWLLHARRQPDGGRTSWILAGLELGKGILTAVAILVFVISLVLLDGYSLARFNTKVIQPGVGMVGGIDAHMFVPFFATETLREYFTFFSWPHLGAIIQEQLLIAPLALLTILATLAFAWTDTLALFKARPALVVLAVGAASAMLYAVSWNPDLGPRNDWDLLALPAIPLTLLAVYLLLHLLAGKARRLALASYLSVSAVHTLAWVLLHTLGIRY